MDKNKLKKYIKEKYNILENSSYSRYIKIDAMIEFFNLIRNNTTILKGALNLFVNFGYEREELTKDIDISLVNISPEKFIKEVSEVFNHKLFEYQFIKYEDINESIEYKGIKMTIKFNVHDLKISDNFSMDISVEELSEYRSGIIKHYSIERSIADKVASMFRLGAINTRKKDFIDFKYFHKIMDDDQFKEDLINIMHARGTTSAHVNQFLLIITDKLSEFRLEEIEEPLILYAKHAINNI